MSIGATAIVPGIAEGPSLVLDQPLSWWGGIDPLDGTIIDAHHPQHGQPTAGRVLILPGGRGSSGGSAVLAESVRLRTAPAALVLQQVDPILVVGLIVASELYPDRGCPLVVAGEGYELLVSGRTTRIRTAGRIEQF
ncbi:MAG: DUF126 domain-containing protein [bacterium]|nr:DUF126 domain-containing protein [bacterium]